MFTARHYSYDPYEDYASSPAASSSPAPCVDSSPPSSPGHEPAELNTADLSPRVLHPFSASAKATRTPREYERKANFISPPSSPTAHTARKRQRLYDSDDEMGSIAMSEDDIDLSLETIVPPNFGYSDQDSENMTDRIWEKAIDDAVEYGRGYIDLSKHELTHIPTKIRDLSHFTALAEGFEHNNASSPPPPQPRQFMRVKSAPIRSSKEPLSLNSARVHSIDDMAMGVSKQAIYLYLVSNSIKRIPMELLAVKKLHVLSLRANSLEYIPPEICALENLAELNVANNKLRFLPAEIQKMRLRQLSVTPNPLFLRPDKFNFLTRESSSRTLVEGATRLERVVSPIRTVPPTVVKMTELCLRLLLTPDPENGTLDPPLCLNHSYPWTLEGCKLPPSDTANILRTYMPRSVTGLHDIPPDSIESAFLTERLPFTDIGVCPSPDHVEPSYFAQHAEERITWEDKVAGVPMTELVPLLWRGCQHGCLQFLTEDDVDTGDKDGEGGSVDDSEEGNTEFEDTADVQPKEIHFSGLLDGEDLADFGDA